MTILGLAESFKTMNRPGPIVTLFDVFVSSESMKDSRNSLLRRDFPRPPGEWRQGRHLWVPSATPLGASGFHLGNRRLRRR